LNLTTFISFTTSKGFFDWNASKLIWKHSKFIRSIQKKSFKRFSSTTRNYSKLTWVLIANFVLLILFFKIRLWNPIKKKKNGTLNKIRLKRFPKALEDVVSKSVIRLSHRFEITIRVLLLLHIRTYYEHLYTDLQIDFRSNVARFVWVHVEWKIHPKIHTKHPPSAVSYKNAPLSLDILLRPARTFKF